MYVSFFLSVSVVRSFDHFSLQENFSVANFCCWFCPLLVTYISRLYFHCIVRQFVDDWKFSTKDTKHKTLLNTKILLFSAVWQNDTRTTVIRSRSITAAAKIRQSLEDFRRFDNKLCDSDVDLRPPAFKGLRRCVVTPSMDSCRRRRRRRRRLWFLSIYFFNRRLSHLVISKTAIVSRYWFRVRYCMFSVPDACTKDCFLKSRFRHNWIVFRFVFDNRRNKTKFLSFNELSRCNRRRRLQRWTANEKKTTEILCLILFIIPKRFSIRTRGTSFFYVLLISHCLFHLFASKIISLKVRN